MVKFHYWIALLIAAGATQVWGAEYPTKAVRIIVPFSAGAAADGVTRVVARKLNDYWGRPVVLDNRPGLPGVVTAANSPADGYTLLMGAGSTNVTSPLVMSKPPYDPQRDFAPVSRLVHIPPILTTHPSLGVKTVKELIAFAKARPGALNYASSGMGAPNHLAMELFMVLTGTNMVHVPYKGAAPAMTDLISGQVQLGFNAIPSVLSHVTTGKLRALAVSGAKRADALPDLPTISESAVRGFQYDIWYGIFAPGKTPSALVAKVSADIQRALAERDVIEQLVAQGTEPWPSTPAELAQYVREDTARWAKIVKERNIKVD
jgi:tripartite-type tricarboxylate transporter receptor subunit TctC